MKRIRHRLAAWLFDRLMADAEPVEVVVKKPGASLIITNSTPNITFSNSNSTTWTGTWQ